MAFYTVACNATKDERSLIKTLPIYARPDRVAWWPDSLSKDTLPKDNLPKDNLPKDTLPNGHFADGRFAKQMFCITDILPKGHFTERTICRK